MKARVQGSSSTSFEEAVTVNQRGLIDKILARYSTELTLFRELLQNSNDAKATELQIRFSGTGYWEGRDIRENTNADGAPRSANARGSANDLPQHRSQSQAQSQQQQPQQQQQQQQTSSAQTRRRPKSDEELSFTGLRLCNNGMVFRDEDWKRIKSIADGNPDETKVGFFGVGFYSVFSLSDEPTVLSGAKALSFHWKKDSLFVTHGAPPAARADDCEEDKVMFDMVEKNWTIFDLPVRDDPPRPKLPSPKEMADFLVRCLTFTTTLELVEVYYDGRLALSVGRESSQSIVPMNADAQARMPQGSMFRYQDARTEPLRYAIQHHDRPKPIVVEMMRVLSSFSVHVDEKFRTAMFRVTKKNPPRKVDVQLIFDAGKALQVSATAASWKALESFSPASARGGHFFIGSGITQQTTGSKCHCNAPFMPTMERNSMDLSDITLATWNRALLWATGFLQRLTFEHLCYQAKALGSAAATPETGSKQDSTAIAHGSPSAASSPGSPAGAASGAGSTNALRHGKLEALFRAYDADHAVQNQTNGSAVDLTQKRRIDVLSAMGTFAMKETTPVQQVGDIVLAGFYNAMSEAPPVWTTTGLRRATHARIKDRTGLHEIVYKAASIVDLPSELPGHGDEAQSSNARSSVADVLAKQAKSALGFFSSFMGSEASEGGSAAQNPRKTDAPTKESLATLCKRFVQELQHRRLLRELDVRDLALELQARSLQDDAEVIKLLRWLLAREQTLRQLREEAAADRVTCFCDWCGNRIAVTVESLKREIRRQQEAERSQGFFSRVTASLTGSVAENVRVSLECSRCQQVSLISPAEVISSLSQVQTATSVPNAKLLQLARMDDGTKLSSFSLYVGATLLKRINSSSEKGMPARLEASFWASSRAKRNVLPITISQEFKDADLRSGVLAQWLKPLAWSEWSATCIETARKAPLESSTTDEANVKDAGSIEKVSLENLAIVSNVLRVVAFALYNNEIRNGDDTIVVSSLMDAECMPVRSRQLMRPSKTYLGAEATGGFSALPVAALCEALEDGTFHVNDAVPRDAAVVRLLKMLGVKQHVDLAFVFEEFNKGLLGWNRQEILHYIASMRGKLDDSEMKRLRKMCFLPKVEIRADGSAHPSLQSFSGSTLHFASKEIAALQVPMVYAIVEEGLPFGLSQVQGQGQGQEQGTDNSEAKQGRPQRTFFDVNAEKIGNATQLLLKDLGVRAHPDLDVVLTRAASTQDKEVRQAALWYLVRHFEEFRNVYTTRVRVAFVPCTDGKLYHPLRCFTNQSVALLSSPSVDADLLPIKYARLLGVRENPSSEEIAQALARSPPDPQRASDVFAFVAGLLPSMQRSHLHELSKRAIVPLPSDTDQATAANFRYVAPGTIYFRPRAQARGKYEGLFPYVRYESDAANMFLRAVGVRDEPTVDELASLLSDSDQAARHLERVGTDGYLQVLRVLAVELASISSSTLRRMSRAKCLLGVRSVDSKMDLSEPSSNPSEEEIIESETECVTYHLESPRRIYINDHAVMYRIFDPLVAPPEDIFEALYHKLGSKTLSSAVAVRTQFSTPYSVTQTTQELESKIRRRVQLFFFKRRRSDFTSDADKWLSVFNTQSKHFVYEVPRIARSLMLDNVQKMISCTAYAVNGNRGRMLLVTSKTSVSECAAELCDVLLGKSTLNDKLLWSTILQSSDQQLRDQGFPVARKMNNPTIAVAAAAAAATQAAAGISSSAVSAAAPTAAAPAAESQAAKSLNLENESAVDSKTPLSKKENTTSATSKGAETGTGAESAAAPKQVPTPALTPAPPTPPTPPGPSPPAASQKRRSLRGLLSSVMPKANAANAASLAKAAAASGIDAKTLQSMMSSPNSESGTTGGSASGDAQAQAQDRAQAQTQAQSQGTQQQQLQPGGGSGQADPLVNRDFRMQALQSGLNRCSPGGGAPVIQSEAGQRVMVPMLDDLHEHNLVRVPIQFAGMDCYVENGAGDPKIYQLRSVEATAFAQLLLGISKHVFGLRSASICHLYYHFEGQTAAFNRGGALYFNFYVFLRQLEVSQWDVHTLVGSDMQPRFVLPPAAVIDWFGVFGHELAHNHKGDHDAEFSHWMMMYLTTFVEALSVHLDNVRQAINLQEMPRGLE